MKRGEVYWAELSPRSGSEQNGARPVIVVSHDAFNETASWLSIIVVPISTTGRQAGRGPTAVELPAGSGGLTRDSVALCHQVTTLDRRKLASRLGALSAEQMAVVGDGLRLAQDFQELTEGSA